MADEKKRVKWVPVVLVGLPVWLVVSTLAGLWLWHQGSEEAEEPAKFATSITEAAVAADMRKLLELAGPRHTADEAGRRGLTRAAAMIEGALGPSNAGYRIRTVAAPSVASESWPVVIAKLPGGDGEPLWVVTGYDQPPEGRGIEANATGVASMLAVAGEVALAEPRRPVFFVFLPHLYDEQAPVAGTLEDLKRFMDREGGGDAIVVVEAMGGDRGLMASSRSPELLATATADGLAVSRGFDAVLSERARDVAAVLESIGLPVVRMGTRAAVVPGEADDEWPAPENHAAASRELATWLRAMMR